MLEVDQREKVKAKLDVLARRNGFLGFWLTSAKDDHNIARPFEVLMGQIFKQGQRNPSILT